MATKSLSRNPSPPPSPPLALGGATRRIGAHVFLPPTLQNPKSTTHQPKPPPPALSSSLASRRSHPRPPPNAGTSRRRPSASCPPELLHVISSVGAALLPHSTTEGAHSAELRPELSPDVPWGSAINPVEQPHLGIVRPAGASAASAGAAPGTPPLHGPLCRSPPACEALPRRTRPHAPPLLPQDAAWTPLPSTRSSAPPGVKHLHSRTSSVHPAHAARNACLSSLSAGRHPPFDRELRLRVQPRPPPGQLPPQTARAAAPSHALHARAKHRCAQPTAARRPAPTAPPAARLCSHRRADLHGFRPSNAQHASSFAQPLTLLHPLAQQSCSLAAVRHLALAVTRRSSAARSAGLAGAAGGAAGHAVCSVASSSARVKMDVWVECGFESDPTRPDPPTWPGAR